MHYPQHWQYIILLQLKYNSIQLRISSILYLCPKLLNNLQLHQTQMVHRFALQLNGSHKNQWSCLYSMNWKRPSATQLCRVEYSFLLASDYFKLHCGIMTESLSVDTFLQDVYCPTLVTHTSKKMLCVCLWDVSSTLCSDCCVRWCLYFNGLSPRPWDKGLV